MKKILFISTCILTTAILFSCKKSKDYGTTVISNPGITFPQSKNLPGGFLADDSISVTSALNALSTPQTLSDIVIALESDFVSTSDIKVKLQLKPSIVPVTAGLSSFPATANLSFPSEVTIPAGQRFIYLPITCGNASVLSLTASYGLGLTMTSVTTGNAQIAANRKDIVITYSVKNSYDGKYSIKGFTLRAGDPILTGNFSNATDVLITTGPTSVSMGKLLPWGNSNDPNTVVSSIAIGNQTFSVDAATNAITWGGAGGSSLLPGYPSRYEPSTRTFYIGITWGAGPGSREAKDTMVYIGPR
jgi:hypothetical protein